MQSTAARDDYENNEVSARAEAVIYLHSYFPAQTSVRARAYSTLTYYIYIPHARVTPPPHDIHTARSLITHNFHNNTKG